MATDLRRTWQILQQPKSSIGKGAFPTYGPVSTDDTVDSEEEEAPKKKNLTLRGKGKRKRAETGPTGPAIEGGGSCGGCLGLYSLPNCFYIFEDKAPAGWKPRASTQRLVEDRIKQNTALAEQIKRLRKGKDTGADDS